MEGKIGSVFESNFTHAVRKNSYCLPVQSSNNIDEPSNKSFELVSKETKDKHVNHMLRNSSIAVGAGVILMAPIVILASKGKLPKPVMNFVDKKSQKIAQKMKELREKPEMTHAEMVYFNSLQKSSKIVTGFKNLLLLSGPMKDVMLEKVLRTVKLGKVCDKISGFFEKMAVKMTSISYQKSSDAFTLMREEFRQGNKYAKNLKNKSKTVEVNGVSKTLGEWVQIAEEKTKQIDTDYEYFRPDAISKRHKMLSKRFNGLGETVYKTIYSNINGFWKFITNPKKMTSFITEDLVAPAKTKFSRTVNSRKKMLTNNSDNVAKELKRVIADIEPDINISDKDSLGLFKHLKKMVEKYGNGDSSQLLEVKQEINSIISKLSDQASGSMLGTDELSSRKIKKSLGYLKYTVESDKKGHVEELLDIYEQILPKERFEKINRVSQRAANALNDAVYTETEKFVDKMRDLKSGAALTDVATGLLVPLGSTAVGMSMADTKEKKRSVGLKLGIPLLVGLGTSMFCTVSMLTAGPAMALGLLMSTITNRVCSKVDDNLKKKDTEKKAMAS